MAKKKLETNELKDIVVYFGFTKNNKLSVMGLSRKDVEDWPTVETIKETNLDFLTVATREMHSKLKMRSKVVR